MISYYELLGLIKEGKQPEKVKFEDYVYYWHDGIYDNDELMRYLFDDVHECEMFIKCIEIIEDKPKIEKIKFNNENKMIDDNVIYEISIAQYIICQKLNEVIDVLNEMSDKDVD